MSTGPLDAPRVTAVTPRGRDRVEVELEGTSWRVVPLEAAVDAGLSVGCVLDRGRARELNRALRRHRAGIVALRALRYADHTSATLDARLARRGVRAEVRAETLARVERAGLVDDERFARGRADTLARRGLGDEAILADLAARGVDDAVAREAVAALEGERERARVIVAARGASVRTARYLASRGFGEDAVEAVIAGVDGDGLG